MFKRGNHEPIRRAGAFTAIIWCVFFLLSQPVFCTPPPDVSGESAYVVDVDTGIVLYSKNPHTTRYPASITKLMTVLLALEYAGGDYKQPVEFYWSSVAGTENTSHIGMKPGEVIPLEEALYAVLLHSANECSNAVAELVAGSQEEFVKMMNARAIELGCLNTNFKNAHGLPDDEHYTTAYDMSLIMREVIKHADFIRFSSTTYYEVSPTEITDEVRPFVNTNRLIRKNSDYYNPLVVCGKTGYTDVARHTLVTLSEKNGARIVCVVMKTPQYGIYTDTTALVDYGFGLYDYITILDKDIFSHTVPVAAGNEIINLNVTAAENVVKYLPASVDTSLIEERIFINSNLQAPVYEGSRIGYLTLHYDGNYLASVNLYAANTVVLPEAQGGADVPPDEQPQTEGETFWGKLAAFFTSLKFLMPAFAAAIAVSIGLTAQNILSAKGNIKE